MSDTNRYGEIVQMPADKYPMPRITPPARHPRVLVAEGEMTALR